MIFRPSARIRLTLRTEEFTDTEPLELRLPSPTGEGVDSPARVAEAPLPPEQDIEVFVQELLQDNQRRLAELERRREELPVDEYTEQREQLRTERSDILRAAYGDEDTSPPESVTGNAPDDLTVLGDIHPISVQIERNGLATANTATVVLNYVDAPFDPRIMRAAHIEAIVGVVPADDYEAGAERNERRDDNSLRSIVPASQDGPLMGATRFVGFVDSWDINYSQNDSTVTLECRDMSAPFRDIKLNTGESIDLSLPIDQGVQAFVDSISAYVRGVRVVYEGEGTAPIPANAAPRRRAPRRGRRRRRSRRGGENMTLWDHITDTVRQLGLVPIVRDFDLVLAEPRTLFATTGVRRMIYGRNIRDLAFTRNLMGEKVPTIEVRSYDPEIGRTRWARWPVRRGERASGIFGRQNPPRALRANEIPPSGSNPEEKIRTILVSGIVDPTILERVARNSFEQIGRQEIEGTFTTMDVSSFDVTTEQANLLRMESGEPIELLIASGDPNGGENEAQPNSTIAQIQAFNRQQRRDFFISLGWGERIANRFADLQEATGFQTVFRVQDVRLDWSNEDGLTINAGFVNYITVREDQDNDG